MTSRYQDNFLHKSLLFRSSISAHSAPHNPSTLTTSSQTQQKQKKWFNPSNLLKITPEPVNPRAGDPFSSEIVSKEDNRKASAAQVKLHDQHKGYAGGWKIVGYYKP